MIKYSDKMHKIFTIISLVLILIGVIRTLFVYKYLPDNIGVHFAADGSFDVIVSKSKLLYIKYMGQFFHQTNRICLNLSYNLLL